MLSKEGRQTVVSAIVSALLETDLELAWTASPDGKEEEDRGKEGGGGTELAPLLEEVKTLWMREEGVAHYPASSKPAKRTAPAANPYAKKSSEEESRSQSSQFGTTPSQLLPPAS